MKVQRQLLFVCFFILAAFAGLQAQTIEHDGLRIIALPDLMPKNFFGYSLCRVMITNSSNRDRDVRLFMQGMYSREIEEVSRSFKIAAGEVREESLLMPIMEFSSACMRVQVDGTTLNEQTLHRNFRSNRNFYNRKQFLVDSRISRSEFDTAFAGTSSDPEMNQFDGSLSQLYSNWLGYSQYQMLFFYASSVNDMPEAIKRAVFDYVRTGGSLLTIGSVNLPDDFVALGQTRQDKPLNLKVFEGGFGRVISGDPDLIKVMSGGNNGAISNYFNDMFSNHEFQNDSPLRFANNETETLSTSWLMVFVYLFAFLIGPVNVFVLHRLGRKILVFLTIPVASAVCCLFIYGYYLTFESSTLLVKRQAVTLLDERYNRAVTLANYSIFSASSRPQGLRFDNQTEVYTYQSNQRRNTDGGKFIVLDEDQHLSTGWIKPKVPRSLHLRALQTRRERVGLSWQNGSLQLLNGLGSDIESIMLMTEDNRVFSGGRIAAGKQALMSAASAKSARPPSTPEQLYSAVWFKELRTLEKTPERYLRPGTYIAKIKTSPFVAQAIDSSADKTEDAYVIGIIRGDAQP